jgi:AcrR family transcriptional regulator
MGHQERKEREQQNIRDSILNAAINIAKSKDWSAVTIRKIAEEIEYAPPIIYEYFQNKDDLIREIIIHGFRKLRQRNEEHSLTMKDQKEQLLVLSLSHWDFAIENKELYRLMFSLERPLPNEEAEKGMIMIKDIIGHVSGKKDKELDGLIFNWICLLNGTIGIIMQYEESEHTFAEKYTVNPRNLFIQFMQRFINSISLE